MKILGRVLFGLLLGASALTLSSCRESDTENAVEDAGEAAGDSVEKAGDKVEDAVD